MSPRTGALVTGAGRGLGAQLAALLADRGHLVMVTDLDGEAARATASTIGRGALHAAVDVRDEAQVGAARDALLQEVDRIEVWVNNAGVLVTGPAWEQDEQQRRLMLEVNALGTITGTVAAIEAMRRSGGGHVVNIASLAGISPVPGEGVYAASKHAVIGFTNSTALDLRLAKVKNIRLSCICPDGIWTPMLHDKLDDPEAALSFSGVLLQPEDVVAGVAKVLDRPRPITALPAWRGIVGRAGSLFPRLSAAVMPLVVRQGRRVQRRMLQERRRGDVVPERDRG